MNALYELIKSADLLESTQLQPHQQAIMDQYKHDPARVLLMHALGSGKSLTGLGLAEQLREPYTAVVPASLRPNMQKEREKFTDLKIPADIASYTGVSMNKPLNRLGTLIFDEAHRLKNEDSKQTIKAKELAERAKQLVLLTGTPIINRPQELAPLISMLTKKPISSEGFENQFIGQKTVHPSFLARLHGVKPVDVPAIRNEDEFRRLMEGHVDYYAPDKPIVGVNHQDIPVEMSPEQTNLWRWMYDKLPWMMRWKIKNNFPLSEQELASAHQFLNGPRQVSLSTHPFLKNPDYYTAFSHSSKLQKANELLNESLKDPRKKALVFSNFIDAGLRPYASALQKANIPHAVFHGGLSDAQRKQLVEDYNKDKLRVALLGPSGSEGLSFRGTQLIQILDPHWNAARSRQAEGRGLRHDSHWGLPEDLQNVQVQRFISRLPEGMRARLWRRFTGKPSSPDQLGHATDDYLIGLANRKEELNQKFINILKDIGSHNRQGTAGVV